MAFPLPTDEEIVAHAREKEIRRGVEYLLEGRVLSLVCLGGSLAAEVEGGQRYHVSLARDEDGAWKAGCTCPFMEESDDGWCKHVVAVILAGKAQARAAETMPLDALLATLSPEELRSVVRRLAERDLAAYDLVRTAAESDEPAPRHPARPILLAS
jgi:uncharacterized Zn finger protein